MRYVVYVCVFLFGEEGKTTMPGFTFFFFEKGDLS